MTFHNYIRKPRAAAPTALEVLDVAKAYNFPAQYTGKGAKIGIIELGGGFKASQIDGWFTRRNLPTPKLTSINVGAGRNKQNGPDGADGEVSLDIIVALGVAPGAEARVYFGGNTDEDFIGCVKQAIADGCTVITISWGQGEDQWATSSIHAFEAVFAQARQAGIPVFAAAGDSGSKDSESHNVTDYPASSPNVIGCGGTRLEIDSNGARSSETVWNDRSVD